MTCSGIGSRPARAAAILLGLVLVSCSVGRRRPEEPAPLRPPVRDSLLAADVARGEAATRLGLRDAAAAWLDPSVVYLRGGAPVLYGRDAAQRVNAALPDAPANTLYRWEPVGGGVARD